MSGDPGVPAIARATALSLLGSDTSGAAARGSRAPADDEIEAALAHGASDPEPLLRFGAARGLVHLAPARRLALAQPLLRDRVRAVREEAARALLPLPESVLSGGARPAFADALSELRASLSLSLERPEVRLDLGGIALVRGELGAAEMEYRAALRLDPSYVPAYANLAETYRLAGREGEAARVLEEGLAQAPGSAPLHHALGLSLIRSGRLAAAMPALRRSVELAPADSRFAQVLAAAQRELDSTRGPAPTRPASRQP